MRISTKRGDSGYTNLLMGERVPKHHLIIEAGGSLDEANSFLGVARASSREKRIKRIILHIQKHLFIIGAELSVSHGKGKAPKTKISETEIEWLERLVDEFEEALALPPGFVAFGQEEGSSHLDVARTSVRKVERMAVKMKSEKMIENPYILKYLNRLSDLIFLLACFEEKDEEEKPDQSITFFFSASESFIPQVGNSSSFNFFYADCHHRPSFVFSSTRPPGEFRLHAKSHETNGKHALIRRKLNIFSSPIIGPWF